jgi:hypothetical protein
MSDGMRNETPAHGDEVVVREGPARVIWPPILSTGKGNVWTTAILAFGSAKDGVHVLGTDPCSMEAIQERAHEVGTVEPVMVDK